MSKRTVFVVGAGKGLGNAIAREFAAHDFRVALISRSEEHLSKYAQEFKEEGIEVYTKVADALYPETLTKAINELIKEVGTPDAFVYNVGVTEIDGDREITNELLLTRFQIDVASAYHCVKLIATDEFAQKKGAILMTGGGLALKPHYLVTPLSIDKAALNAANTLLHNYYEPKGIFVGSVLVDGLIGRGNPLFEPSVIAKEYWKMYTERKEFQVLYTDNNFKLE